MLANDSLGFRKESEWPKKIFSSCYIQYVGVIDDNDYVDKDVSKLHTRLYGTLFLTGQIVHLPFCIHQN